MRQFAMEFLATFEFTFVFRHIKFFVRNGNDLLLELYVPFTTALLGGKVTIPTLKGTYDLEIKELTQSGTIMRLKGKGVKNLEPRSLWRFDCYG